MCDPDIPENAIRLHLSPADVPFPYKLARTGDGGRLQFDVGADDMKQVGVLHGWGECLLNVVIWPDDD
jgi:hypothetical protein